MTLKASRFLNMFRYNALCFWLQQKYLIGLYEGSLRKKRVAEYPSHIYSVISKKEK